MFQPIPSCHPLLVLYGSQTGNAQDVAELIGREATRRFFNPRVLPADAYARSSLSTLPDEIAIVFVVSTTGQGDPPENISALWKFLRRKSLPADALVRVTAAVFGLGDSGYLGYNVMAKLLYRRLEALGANMVAPLGLGDDQHRAGYDAALDEWLPRLWTGLRARFPLPRGEPYVNEPDPRDCSAPLVPKYRVTFLLTPPLESSKQGDRSAYEDSIAAMAALQALDARVDLLSSASLRGAPNSAIGDLDLVLVNGDSPGSDQKIVIPSAARPYMATVAQNRRVTAESHAQNVHLLTLDVANSGIDYSPGDVLALWPQQRWEVVTAFCQRCGLDPGSCIRIEAWSTHSVRGDIPTPAITVQVGPLIAGALDISSASPKRSFFGMLAQLAPPGLHADRLAHFASPSGRDDLHEYCRREGRTVLEVLDDFPSITPSLEWLLSFAPRLVPRRFSAASSLMLCPGRADVLVAQVEWTTPHRRRRRGLCSSWLTALPQGAQVAVWAEQGALRMPKDMTVPLILVGPGTGVAPFRCFLQHRRVLMLQEKRRRPEDRQVDNPQVPGVNDSPLLSPCTLIFGCRHESQDFLCREDWEEMQREGVLGGAANGGLITAFSRDQATKVYVQHRIREYGRELWGLIHRGGSIFVAGNANKMPTDVRAAFVSIMIEHGGLDASESELLLRRMEATGRYQVECWA